MRMRLSLVSMVAASLLALPTLAVAQKGEAAAAGMDKRCEVCTAKATFEKSLRCAGCAKAEAPCAKCVVLVAYFEDITDPVCAEREMIAACAECKMAGKLCARCAAEAKKCAECAEHKELASETRCEKCEDADAACAKCKARAEKIAKAPCAACTIKKAVADGKCVSCAVRQAALIASTCEDCTGLGEKELCAECKTQHAALEKVACATHGEKEKKAGY